MSQTGSTDMLFDHQQTGMVYGLRSYTKTVVGQGKQYLDHEQDMQSYFLLLWP